MRVATESLESFLREGSSSVLSQLSRYLEKGRARKWPGPYAIKVSTRLDGQSEVAFEPWALTSEQANDNAATNLVQEIYDAVIERLGPAPVAYIRVRIFHEGRSADGVDVTRKVAPQIDGSIGTERWLIESQQQEIASLRATVIQIVQSQVQAVHSLAALQAESWSAHAQVASTRGAASAGADLSSPWGLLGVAAVSALIPLMLRESRPGGALHGLLDTLKSQVATSIAGADRARAAFEGGDIELLPPPGGLYEVVEQTGEPAFEHPVPTEGGDHAAAAAVIEAQLQAAPGLLAQVIERIQADPVLTAEAQAAIMGA